ncbi:hypothetical protein SD70_02530 [Gordoniibacillus kamchatkensis]|uniref:Uncharacterized protein n=1 Tax=Gordoniibacillus kamchatkensis TaxID=1590651 RepID=A0ABR5AM55_9BACL|nr:hypothetical protein [Paenibacillus sp. VKM B-2647]KIL42079.1 hypothetical protein SD70_02530 [Paenibacillus sp. VKM B-2647]
MATINKQVQSANLLVIQFDGQQIGIVNSARFSGDFGLTDESGIGDNVVVEYVPGIAHVNVSASGIVLIQKNLLSAGIVPSSSVRDILQGKVFDIGVFNRTSGAWLLKASDCSVASIDIAINTGRAVSFDASFRARDLSGTLLG